MARCEAHVRADTLSHICAHAHSHGHTLIHTHMHTHMCNASSKKRSECARTHTQACTHTHTHTRSLSRTHIHTHARARTHTHVCPARTRSHTHRLTHMHFRIQTSMYALTEGLRRRGSGELVLGLLVRPTELLEHLRPFRVCLESHLGTSQPWLFLETG